MPACKLSYTSLSYGLSKTRNATHRTELLSKFVYKIYMSQSLYESIWRYKKAVFVLNIKNKIKFILFLEYRQVVSQRLLVASP